MMILMIFHRFTLRKPKTDKRIFWRGELKLEINDYRHSNLEMTVFMNFKSWKKRLRGMKMLFKTNGILVNNSEAFREPPLWVRLKNKRRLIYQNKMSQRCHHTKAKKIKYFHLQKNQLSHSMWYKHIKNHLTITEYNGN